MAAKASDAPPAPLSPIAHRIQERLNALGLSARAASIAATGSDGTIRNVLLGKSITPHWETIQKLAKVLKVTPQWLLTGDDTARVIEGDGDVYRVEGGEPPRILRGSDSVPILGTAAGSIIKDDFEGFTFDGAELGYTGRPLSLAKVAEAYALLIVGDSMVPLHPPGKTRLVNPKRPTAPGDSVIVITKHWDDDPGQAYIKILLRRTQTSVVLQQLHPEAIVEIPTKYVASIHYVLTYDDLLGAR